MDRKEMLVGAATAVMLALLATGVAMSAQDKDGLRVPNGLAISEFKGYEGWQTISLSLNGGKFAVILGNPAMIDAYKSGIPENGKPFPDGAKMAKIHWNPKTEDSYPGPPQVPGTIHDVDFMVKDSKRFPDTDGWGFAEFEYDDATRAYRPGTLADHPPQGNDAKCGFACHTIARKRDYVFTEYAYR
jgi:Cytochrome P460